MSEWQPIETAPKEGREILGAFVGNGWIAYSVVRWHKHRNGQTGNFKHMSGVWNPTHWMPLPEPPK